MEVYKVGVLYFNNSMGNICPTECYLSEPCERFLQRVTEREAAPKSFPGRVRERGDLWKGDGHGRVPQEKPYV